MKKYFKGFSNIAVSVSLLVIIVYLWRSRSDLQGMDWQVMLPDLGLSMLLYGISLGAQGVVWIVIMSRSAGIGWSFWDVVVYLQTHLVRRLPGAPWYMASRAIMYEARGPDGPAAAIAASLFEWIGTFCTALIWVVMGRWGWGWGLLSLLVLLGLATLLPALHRSGRLPKRLRRLGVVPRQYLYGAIAVYCLVWILATLILRLVLRTVAPDAQPAFGSLASAWSLSAAVSMLTFFAPAGLGVRELTLVAQLEPLMGLAAGTLAALLTRLIYTIGDVFCYGLAVLVRWFMPKQVS